MIEGIYTGPTFLNGWESKAQNTDFVKLVMDEGDVFEGAYLGATNLTGANGDFIAHALQSDSDKEYSATGASLNSQLQGVDVGTRVRITFNGLKNTKTPGRQVKDYEVQVYVPEADETTTQAAPEAQAEAVAEVKKAKSF